MGTISFRESRGIVARREGEFDTRKIEVIKCDKKFL
jgi:hypothetical protein